MRSNDISNDSKNVANSLDPQIPSAGSHVAEMGTPEALLGSAPDGALKGAALNVDLRAGKYFF